MQGRSICQELGVSCHDVTVDYASVMLHVRETIAAIEPHDSQERFEGLGVRVIRGYAEFASKNSVRVGDETVTARRIVVRLGRHPSHRQSMGWTRCPISQMKPFSKTVIDPTI